MKHLVVQIFITIFTLQTSRSFDCTNTNLCSCESQGVLNSKHEIDCTKDSQDLVVKFELQKQLSIQCTLYGKKFYLQNITNYNIGPIKRVELKFCPQPTNDFSEIFDKFNITEIKQLNIHSVEDNDLQQFDKHMFKNLSNLEWLELCQDKIDYIQHDLFEYLSNLKVLNLNSNKIVTLHVDTFKYVPNLMDIELSMNNISKLESDTFYPLKKLKRLHLFKNNLNELPEDLFKNNLDLEELELSNNPIEKLSDNQFYSNINLSVLSLKSTKINDVPSDIFKTNNKLKIIQMDCNNLTLRDSFIRNMTSLISISLKDCKLLNLPIQFFEGCKSLETIQLSDNYLEELPNALLDGLNHLEELNLSKNKLRTINDDLFNNLERLKVLLLNDNQLEMITDHVFKDLHGLKELDLSNNNIKFVSESAFYSLKNLITLRMSNNKLSSTFVFPNIINQCTEIEKVYLDNNEIQKLGDYFHIYVHLKLIDLSNNALESLDVYQLQFVSNNTIDLKMENNNISNVDFHDYDLIFKENPNLNLYLTGNPIMCNCELYEFVKFIHESSFTNLVLKDDLSCSQPANLKEISLNDLDLNELLCPLERCPDYCQCFQRTHDKSYIVDCSNKNFTKSPNLTMFDSAIPKELNMIGNNLKELTKIHGGDNITKLYLADNDIEKLHWVPPNVEILMLNNNSFTSINHEIIDQLNRSTSLKLMSFENNPWMCDCSTSKFANFLRQQSIKQTIKDKNIICANNNKMLIHLNAKDLCRNTTQVLLICGIVSITLLAILLIIIALYYKYTEEVKIWLFAHNLLLWFVTEEEIDKDKEFDAFVSFAHQDQEFVEKELLPVLENGPEQYKLCLHYRNWIGGEYILTQIIKSVEDSRRTIIVLSENFLKSLWGKMEFRMAHQKALRERCARVIIIIYGDVNPNEIIDDELKTYLKTNTYIEWGDPWFWNKLKYALPHSHKKRKMDNKRIVNMFANIDKLDLIPTTPNTPNVESTPPIEITLNPLLLKERNLNGSLPKSSPVEENNREL